MGLRLLRSFLSPGALRLLRLGISQLLRSSRIRGVRLLRLHLLLLRPLRGLRRRGTSFLIRVRRVNLRMRCRRGIRRGMFRIRAIRLLRVHLRRRGKLRELAIKLRSRRGLVGIRIARVRVAAALPAAVRVAILLGTMRHRRGGGRCRRWRGLCLRMSV